MTHLTHPTSGEYLRKWHPNGHFETTTDREKAACLYPEDLQRIRDWTGIDWKAAVITTPEPGKEQRT